MAGLVQVFGLQAGLNLIVDPFASSRLKRELVSVRMEQITPLEALNKMLAIRGFKLLWNPDTQVARVVDPAFAATEIPNPVQSSNGEPIPLRNNTVLEELVFNDQTLEEVLRELARKAQLNIQFDPRVQVGITGPLGIAPAPQIVDLRWKGLSAYQALVALVEYAHLTLTYDAYTTVARIAYAQKDSTPVIHDEEWMRIPANAGSGKNLPVILMEEAPLEFCVNALASQASVNILFDPDLTVLGVGLDGDLSTVPFVDLRFYDITPLQAMTAVLENHLLVPVWNPRLKVARITTREKASLTSSFEAVREVYLTSSTEPDPAQPRMVIDRTGLGDLLLLLGRQCGIPIQLDPALDPEKGGRTLPEVSLVFTKVNAQQAIAALLDNYRLSISWDPAQMTAIIRP